MSVESANAGSSATPAVTARGRWSRWYIRMPLKAAIFAVVTFFVLNPNPAQFARHVSHITNMQAMIEPDAPELRAWADRLQNWAKTPAAGPATSQRAGGAARSTAEVQREIERFVLENVHYEWDWNLWGSADYMPTVGEMFARAKVEGGPVREDCDGRAVMAASLMKRLGYNPSLVTDLRHVWVETPEGAWMGPGEAKTMVVTSQETKVHYSTAARNFAIGLSYGIAVFPLGRELIILLTAFILLLRRRTSGRWALGGLLLLVQGLLFMRLGFLAPQAVSREVSSWPAWVGLVHIAFGFGVLWLAGHRRTIADGPVKTREADGIRPLIVWLATTPFTTIFQIKG